MDDDFKTLTMIANLCYKRSTSASEVALYKNKTQGMALSARANITGLNHTLQQLITQLALYKLGNPRESTQNSTLITT